MCDNFVLLPFFENLFRVLGCLFFVLLVCFVGFCSFFVLFLLRVCVLFIFLRVFFFILSRDVRVSGAHFSFYISFCSVFVSFCIFFFFCLVSRLWFVLHPRRFVKCSASLTFWRPLFTEFQYAYTYLCDESLGNTGTSPLSCLWSIGWEQQERELP